METQRKPLAGLAHLLRPDPGKVDTAAKFNAHIDKVCEVLQARKVELDSNAPAEPVLEPDGEPPDETEEEAKKRRKRKAKSKPNRMNEGGEDRDDAA